MKIFLDTANVEEIREIASWGILDGVTTNPSLIAKTGQKFEEVIADITEIVNGPISAEVLSDDCKSIIREAEELSSIHKNIVIKIPITEEGLKATDKLFRMDIPVNMTLVFSSHQALLAAKAGARYISPFIGRIDDMGENGIKILSHIIKVTQEYKTETIASRVISTKIIAASIRHLDHVKSAALLNCDIATIPYKVLKDMIKHPLTDKGIKKFKDDWKKSSQGKN